MIKCVYMVAEMKFSGCKKICRKHTRGVDERKIFSVSQNNFQQQQNQFVVEVNYVCYRKRYLCCRRVSCEVVFVSERENAQKFSHEWRLLVFVWHYDADWFTNFISSFHFDSPPQENALKEEIFFTLRERRNFISIFLELIKNLFFLWGLFANFLFQSHLITSTFKNCINHKSFFSIMNFK